MELEVASRVVSFHCVSTSILTTSINPVGHAGKSINIDTTSRGITSKRERWKKKEKRERYTEKGRGNQKRSETHAFVDHAGNSYVWTWKYFKSSKVQVKLPARLPPAAHVACQVQTERATWAARERGYWKTTRDPRRFPSPSPSHRITEHLRVLKMTDYHGSTCDIWELP